MRILAPAKINLGLRIVGVRPDGYHELDSLFLPLDLADIVEVRSADSAHNEVLLQVDGIAPNDASNLAVRAAEAFAKAAGTPLRTEIELTKRTPMAAGLGGGSSDAAAVLRALAELHRGRVSTSELTRLALSLGADVPFFLDPRPTRVRGIGEQLEPVAGLPSLALVLANPGAPVPTAEAYRAYDALGAKPSAGLVELPDLSGPASDALVPWLENDLEPAAIRLCPAVARIRQALTRAGAVAVGLSGSGATLYGVCRDLADARGVAAKLQIPDPGWSQVVITAESP